MKITSREWGRLSKDYKSETNGQKRIMIYDNGTCVVDVEIDDVHGVEMGVYSFSEYGIRYKVCAYTVEDALRIIRECGHEPSAVKDLTRLKSL